MLFFVLETHNLRLKDVNLQLLLCQIFLKLLQLIFGQVELILGTRKFALKVLHLAHFDADLTL